MNLYTAIVSLIHWGEGETNWFTRIRPAAAILVAAACLVIFISYFRQEESNAMAEEIMEKCREEKSRDGGKDGSSL